MSEHANQFWIILIKNIKMEITDKTPIVMLTVGQLKGIIRQEMEQSELMRKQEKCEEVVEYVYGLRGIRNEFNVSHATA